MSTGTINLSTPGNTKEFRFIVPTTTTPYSANDQVGALITVPCARVDGFGSILQSIAVLDGNGQKASLDVFLFNQAPTVTSVDNGAVNVTFANSTGKASFVCNIATYNSLGTPALGQSATFSEPCTPNSGQNFYALIVTRGTPTYLTNGLEIIFKFMPDSLNDI